VERWLHGALTLGLAPLLLVQGRWQREGAVCNLIAHRLWDLSPLLGRVATQSRDFR